MTKRPVTFEGHFAVLFTLMIIRGLLLVALRKKTGTSSPRHLLDMTVEERWRYIEDKDEGDLEEHLREEVREVPDVVVARALEA